MNHENFFHKEAMVSFDHLSQISRDFNWTTELGTQTYRAWIRYSNHCYSRELDPGEQKADDDYVVEQSPKLRVFCPERYHQSQKLVGIIGGLFHKPTTKVALTYDKNWMTFQLHQPSSTGQGRYCVFFRIKNSPEQPPDDNLHFLDMHIESAYNRSNMVQTLRACPFGQVAHMVKHQLKFH